MFKATNTDTVYDNGFVYSRNDYSVLTGVKKLAQFMYEITARFVPKFEKSCLFVVFVYISVW